MSILIKKIPTVLAAVLMTLLLSACEQQSSQTVFDTPEAAIQTLSELIGNRDEERIEQVFGPGSVDIFLSGDNEADREDYDRVQEMIQERVGFEDYDDHTKIPLLGDDAWPWPIPLVEEGSGWRFDMDDGREELLNRRIGRNELWVLTSLHEVVDAQREYKSEARNGNPPAFAQKFRSSEGMQDGLFWVEEEGVGESPLGGFLAESEHLESEPQPFNGYYYRILTRRGANAPGGELDFVDDNGLMTRGFAVLAWPAKYGNSGIMTFMINEHGLVLEKDLGDDTENLAEAMDSYNPDSSWAPTDDTLAGDVDED